MKTRAAYSELMTGYRQQQQPDPYQPVEEYFTCQVSNMGSVMLPVLNGWYVHQGSRLTRHENGVIAGSLQAALQECPELVRPHLNRLAAGEHDELTASNERQFTDGVFIHVPDHVKVPHPLQIVSLVNSREDLLVQTRNIIAMGRDAELSLIQCDDSSQYGKTFLNIFTGIFLEENARLHYYKTENKEAESLLFHHIHVYQKQHSFFLSNAITFNAGYVCNNIRVSLDEPFAEARLYGLYLVDKTQRCDNRIKVLHNCPDCKSHQLYKGILDDEAEALFHGHVVVRPDAQRTNAFQTNRNLLLTDKAKVNTQPFLEIYADDVQCSHGATVGQLDDEALYYLRTRGVGERSARKLLMFAFANEICQHVTIQALKDRLSDMVQRRLNGELTICDQCMLHNADNSGIIFPIDPSQL